MLSIVIGHVTCFYESSSCFPCPLTANGTIISWTTTHFSYISRSVLSWRTGGNCSSPTTWKITTALHACIPNTYGKSHGKGRDTPQITATHTRSEAMLLHRPSSLRWPSNQGQSCPVDRIQVWSSTQGRVCPAVMGTWLWARPWRRFWRTVSFNLLLLLTLS